MYYPKSQITPNLYSNGEFIYLNNRIATYTGYYFKTSKNKYFTGRDSSDLPNVEIIPIESIGYNVDLTSNKTPVKNVYFYNDGGSPPPSITNSPLYNEILAIEYFQLKKTNLSKVTYLPTYSPTLPTQQDYANGEMRRYFCKKTNEIIYLEVSKDTYDKLVSQDSQILWQLYQPFNLPWQLSGSKEQVYKTNKNIVELTSVRQKLPMLMEYLKMDFTKYYKQ